MIANYKMFVKDVQKVAKETGVPASVTLAQIILESSGGYDNGLSWLGAKYKNLFGVKGTGPGGTISLPTYETYNGKTVKINANFRVYNNYYESILDHAKVLLQSFYTVNTSKAKNVDEYAKAIHKSGYATDPAYSNKLIKIMNEYNLKQYDVAEEKKPAATKPAATKPAATIPNIVTVNGQKLNVGTSLVDFMKWKKLGSTFKDQQKLASKNGIKNYQGTAAQNTQLLNTLKKQYS